MNNCGKHCCKILYTSFLEWINPWKRGQVWRLVILQSLFLISPLFLNTSYSPSAILDYDWHFSYVAYIREGPKQEPAGRKMGKHFPKFFIKKVSALKSTSGFCCWDFSLLHLFQSLYYFCKSVIESSLCVYHYIYLGLPDNLAASKILFHLKSNYCPQSPPALLGV